MLELFRSSSMTLRPVVHVVATSAAGLWPSREQRLSRRLARRGHRVMFVAMADAPAVGYAHLAALLTAMCFLAFNPAAAQQATDGAPQNAPPAASTPPAAPSMDLMFGEATETLQPVWQYGGFVDVGYLRDFNHPSNHLFRSRGTAFHVNEWDLNMAGAYVKKKASEKSRWGTELLVQGGKDEEVFGFSATAPNLAGADWLGHFGLANVSYLAPVGTGLTVQGGIFASFIGYDSLYAKDNFNYTRPWGADFTPYLMTGINASYNLTDKAAVTGLLVNGYWHLADANHVPTLGGQLAYKATPQVTAKETVLWGPHQADTSLKFWRFLSDTIVERRAERVIAAFEYQLSTENAAASGDPRAWWMSAQLPIHWTLREPWSVAVRPEVAWDSTGRWTGSEQSIEAVTTTVEYRKPFQWANAILRLEHRFDDSRGPGGGFFTDGELTPGVVGLKPTQHLLTLGLIFTFDSPPPH
jgi:hypothetical protein